MKLGWTNILHPPPAPPGFGRGKVLPETTASWVSRLTLHWLGSFLNVGFSRPLMEDDFWELRPPRHTEVLANDVERNFYARCSPEKRPLYMREANSVNEKVDEIVDEKNLPAQDDAEAANSKTQKYDESLFMALFITFKKRIGWATILLLISDTLKTVTPLVSKVLLTWLTVSYVYYRLPDAQRTAAGLSQPEGVGYGIGLAFAIFAMQVAASLMANHFTLAAMTTGLYLRTGIIGAIFRKSLRLSGKSRAIHTVGQITTMISVDATRLDAFAGFAPYLISAPIQLVIGIGLLIGNLGYCALVGFGVMVAAMPFQIILVKIMMDQQRKGVKITDKRVRLTTEVLQGIRLIKVYGWEPFYVQQISKFRAAEIATVRKASIVAALLVAMFSFVPILAIILTFITYSLTGHDLNIAVIFTALMLFNNIRIPLIMFPLVLSSMTDALVSLGRISRFFLAEELADPYRIDSTQSMALHVDADFQWETFPGLDNDLEEKEVNPQEELKAMIEEKKRKKEEDKKKRQAEKEAKGGKSSGWRKSRKASEQNVLPLTATSEDEKISEEKASTPEEQPFGLENLKLEIPKGSFVAIVGPVGSGKSSVLQALIGEMKRTKGEVTFGGSVAYVSQLPWIKNATVRDNILFGADDDGDRYHRVVSACSLEHDLNVLPHGDLTEIGEKGVNLSGGQKARVSLARAAYSSSDIVLLDDPLSAVDAYVGRSILEDCLLKGPLSDRTRILVTHALQFLDRTDYIYVMDNGKIIEQGSFSDLMTTSVTFRRLIEEHGNQDSKKRVGPDSERAQVAPVGGPVTKGGAALMEEEERNVGAVSWDIYKKYFGAAGGVGWVPIVLLLLLLNEAGNVASTLFLGFWTGNQFPNLKQGHYIAIYGGLGGVAALLTYLVTYAFLILSLAASLNLFKSALAGVLRSPVSFFDTTPIGRISSRLTKDQSTVDNTLPLTLMQFLTIFFNIFGTIALVFYTFPYLGIIFVPLVVLYYAASVYYRRSSVEAKRLDSVLRSHLYGSYSETLTGLPTIRAYSKQTSSVHDAETRLDVQNRAYLMTVAMQRWLAIRLDFMGNILVLGIGLFGAATRFHINPSKTSVVLTYTLSITQTFAEIVSLFASTEQNMNSVERILHYTELPDQGNQLEKVRPPDDWPAHGGIKFNHVKMSYRQGLPLVLKDVSFSFRPGEKIGIVGRTGSGKSSLVQAILRLVELQEGSIEIDDQDIAHIHLYTLRNRIAFVPQDATLFLGTLRDNLDPQRLRTDAELLSVLQRAWLVPKDTPADPSVVAKFSLDSSVSDEGSNYSAGEKQLLALGRALVKNSRIIILDEATSSVDHETDAKIQRTIQTEFASSTLLCIAHRLNTIAHYDRILVMDDGHVAECDTPLNLFDDPNSVFRSLCDEASLSRTDIQKLRGEYTH